MIDAEIKIFLDNNVQREEWKQCHDNQSYKYCILH